MRRRRSIFVLMFALMSLSACATPQLHSDAQLNAIGQRCGLALGELIQDEEQKKLLLMIRQSPTIGAPVQAAYASTLLVVNLSEIASRSSPFITLSASSVCPWVRAAATAS